MISFPNNIRFRFRDEDKDSQVIVSTKDFDKMVRGIRSETKVAKPVAEKVLLQSFYNEIKRVYGEPSKVTVILDQTEIVVH
jgi:hypothetical protein